MFRIVLWVGQIDVTKAQTTRAAVRSTTSHLMRTNAVVYKVHSFDLSIRPHLSTATIDISCKMSTITVIPLIPLDSALLNSTQRSYVYVSSIQQTFEFVFPVFLFESLVFGVSHYCRYSHGS
jgi:hypothetical protein